MSSANINSGPANCMKFNSSFLFYIGFFVLLVIGYMWGKRNGTKEERIRDAKSDAKKLAAAKTVSSVASETDSAEVEAPKPVKAKKASKAASKAASSAKKASKAAGSKAKEGGKKLLKKVRGE